MTPDSNYRLSSSASVKVLDFVQSGGAGGIRTPYLLTASQTLSQLSYSPTQGRDRSRPVALGPRKGRDAI